MPIEIPLPISKGGTAQAATGANAFAAGYSINSSGNQSVSIGNNINSFGNDSIVIGKNSNAFGNQNICIGLLSNAGSGGNSIAIGTQSLTYELESIAIGTGNTAIDGTGIAIGVRNESRNGEGIAFGYENYASDQYCISIGRENTSLGEKSIAFGHDNETNGINSIAIGINNTTNNEGAIAVGYGNAASFDDSVLFGISNSIEDTGVAIGQNNIISPGAVGAVAVGSGNQISSFASSIFGIGNYSTEVGSGYKTVLGINNTIENGNIIVGSLCEVDGGSISIGQYVKNSGSNSIAIGDNIQSTVANTVELGYWSSDTTRDAAIRLDSTGMAALTVPDSATALTDGGSTAGSEVAGSLPRKSAAFRSSDGSLFVDYNDNDGNVKTAALAPFRGQGSKVTTGTITFSGTGTYADTGITATFDTATAFGTTAGSGGFSIKNTSGATRIVSVTAAIEIERTSSGTNDIGIKLAKNGSPINETEIQENTSQNNPAYITTTWIVELADDDEVSILIANMTSTDSVQFNRGRIVVLAAD